MTRVKRGTIAMKKRRSILAQAKGYRLGRSKKEKQANEAIRHAGAHAFAHRRKKKGDFRKLWTIRINGMLMDTDTSYSVFINKLNKKGVKLNRKMLSEIAKDSPEQFKKIVEFIS